MKLVVFLVLAVGSAGCSGSKVASPAGVWRYDESASEIKAVGPSGLGKMVLQLRGDHSFLFMPFDVHGTWLLRGQYIELEPVKGAEANFATLRYMQNDREVKLRFDGKHLFWRVGRSGSALVMSR